VYALFAMTAAQAAGNDAGVMAYMDEFYFESAAMILALITVGKMLEAKSKGKTTDALKKPYQSGAQDRQWWYAAAMRPKYPVEQVRTGRRFSWCARREHPG
jgi:Cu2+-exporting ATPase